MMFVYPRLLPHAVGPLLERVRQASVAELREVSSLSHPDVEYYTSGVAVDNPRLAQVRAQVRTILDDLGFPAAHRGQAARTTAFDRRVGPDLHTTMQIVPADAASTDVWAFITLVLLPDAAKWRYPDSDVGRLLGGPRNIFRRLWWRAETLGAGFGDPPAKLGEDQLVQVMERPSISGDPRIARAFCSAFLREQAAAPATVRPMVWMRNSVKRLIRVTAYVALGALEDVQLDEVMNEVVRAARATSSDRSPS